MIALEHPMHSEECPRCGAGLRLETRGELLDKIQACSHCDFERDVLDEVTIQKEEAGKKVTIHRKDLGSQDITSDFMGDSELQAKVREATGMGMAELLSGAKAVHGSGKTTTTTTTTTTTSAQNFSGADAHQKMAELGIDFGQVVRDAQAQAPAQAPVVPASGKSRGKWIGWVLLILILGGLGALGWFLNQ